MNKQEFLKLLKKGLSDLPQKEIDERLNFYSEMIDDYIEEGLTEEQAVARIGSVNEIAAQIIGDTPLPDPTPVAKQRNPWKIAMIILSSPVWFSLLIGLFSVAISVYASLWAIIISLWSVFGALSCCAVGGILGGIILATIGHRLTGAALIGAGIVCAGLAILAFFICKITTKGAALLTKKLAASIKNKLSQKEDA